MRPRIDCSTKSTLNEIHRYRNKHRYISGRFIGTGLNIVTSYLDNRRCNNRLTAAGLRSRLLATSAIVATRSF